MMQRFSRQRKPRLATLLCFVLLGTISGIATPCVAALVAATSGAAGYDLAGHHDAGGHHPGQHEHCPNGNTSDSASESDCCCELTGLAAYEGATDFEPGHAVFLLASGPLAARADLATRRLTRQRAPPRSPDLPVYLATLRVRI